MLLHPTPKSIERFSQLFSEYDFFIFDIHGVVHDGVDGFPDAIDCINKIVKCRKPVLFVSNNPRPNKIIYDRLISMGISRDVKVYTSGDLVLQYLVDVYPKCRIFHLCEKRNRDLFADTRHNLVQSIEEAELVILSLNLANREEINDYESCFDQIVSSNLRVICANPDKIAPHGTSNRMCAGTFADILVNRGVDVIYMGKPEKNMFEFIVQNEKHHLFEKKGLMIGDTAETDICFARRNNLAALLVFSGITGQNSQVTSHHPFSKLQNISQDFLPDYCIDRLHW